MPLFFLEMFNWNFTTQFWMTIGLLIYCGGPLDFLEPFRGRLLSSGSLVFTSGGTGVPGRGTP